MLPKLKEKSDAVMFYTVAKFEGGLVNHCIECYGCFQTLCKLGCKPCLDMLENEYALAPFQDARTLGTSPQTINPRQNTGNGPFEILEQLAVKKTF